MEFTTQGRVFVLAVSCDAIVAREKHSNGLYSTLYIPNEFDMYEFVLMMKQSIMIDILNKTKPMSYTLEFCGILKSEINKMNVNPEIKLHALVQVNNAELYFRTPQPFMSKIIANKKANALIKEILEEMAPGSSGFFKEFNQHS